MKKLQLPAAIHSPNDGPLLQRLHDELVKAGFRTDKDWNRNHNPLTGNFTMAIYESTMMCFFCHDCYYSNRHHIDLTDDNFDATLQAIIAAKP